MELLTTAEMARADALAIASGVSGFTLMTAAGRGVAQAAQDLVPDGPIVVVAGLGNNGGDGFVAAAELAQLGRAVTVVLAGDRGALKGDAARAAAAWKGDVRFGEPGAIGRPALIVDALFGAGLDRNVEGMPRALIEAMNTNGAPIVAVDLPSGVNGTTGAVMGCAVQATETVTFFRRKPGHLLLPGKTLCGRVRLVDIGIPSRVLGQIGPNTFENDPVLWAHAYPVADAQGHKYSRGHAVVVSGGASATGAARLAARAALRAGAGLATVASPREALAINAAALTAVMVRAIDTPAEFGTLLDDTRINVCIIGPGAGVGPRTRELVMAALAQERALVLDADALTSFADQPEELFDAVKAAKSPVVMTPHFGEYSRLFNTIVGKHHLHVKPELARLAARESGAIMVLKGADTTVAGPDGKAAIAANAPPWLATAGAGDVLAGIIAGLLAQRVAPFEAAAMGVWIHGEAARAVGPGLIAEDLPEALPGVTRQLYDRFGIDRGR